MSEKDRYMTDDYEVIFRPLMDHLPGEWGPGVIWFVEVWERDSIENGTGLEFPLGIATVTYGLGPPYIQFLYVVDFFRKKGVGSLLIDAIANRWPDVQASGAVSEGGEKLVERLQKRREQNAWAQAHQRGQAAGG